MNTTVVGTPFYLPPDVIVGHGYSAKVDLWTLGCICYQLVFGKTPFSRATNFLELYSLIVAGSWSFPADADGVGSTQFRNFVSQLLVVDPAQRLSAAEASHHPWFASQWAKERLKLLFDGL